MSADDQLRVFRRHDLARLTGFSERTIDRMRRKGTVPPPDVSASRLIGWRAATVERWLDSLGRTV
jgi:predicted DNA-binding transcriptional regulator AlpA